MTPQQKSLGASQPPENETSIDYVICIDMNEMNGVSLCVLDIKVGMCVVKSK